MLLGLGPTIYPKLSNEVETSNNLRFGLPPTGAFLKNSLDKLKAMQSHFVSRLSRATSTLLRSGPCGALRRCRTFWKKSVRELVAIRLNDSLIRVFMLQLSSPARSIAMGSLFEVGVGSCLRVPFLLVSAQRSSATEKSTARSG